jgi:lipopolysaccharide biosynthesis glycosyltransferase
MSQLLYTAADANYSLQAQVLMQSLAKTQTTSTHLIVFGNDWKIGDIKRISNLQTSSVSVEVRSVDTDKFSSVKLASKFPLATAYNVLAPSHLLDDAGRALYVDADVVITRDLSELFSMEMSTSVAAVLDAHIAWIGSPSMWRPWREEHIPPLTPYLNTGVLLLDLDRWRENDLTGKIIEVLQKYELPCVDQDAINIVLKGNFDRLAPKFNLMPYHYLTLFRYVDAIESDESIEEALLNPAIIHFHRSFLGKPWTYGAIHPGTAMWRNLASDVNPKWRKSLDISGYVRRIGARYAKMLKIDERAINFDVLRD